LVVEPAGWFGLVWSLSCVAPAGVVLLAGAPVLVVEESAPVAEEPELIEPELLPMPEEPVLPIAPGAVEGAVESVGAAEGVGAGAADMLEFAAVVVGGSMLSALLQAVRATAASTGARRVTYFMMRPFIERKRVMSLRYR